MTHKTIMENQELKVKPKKNLTFKTVHHDDDDDEVEDDFALITR
jgi:hypothetical protein